MTVIHVSQIDEAALEALADRREQDDLARLNWWALAQASRD